MNTLKPLVIFAILVGVCYGVYSHINQKPAPPPPEGAENWTGVPDVQLPDSHGGYPGQGPGGQALAGNPYQDTGYPAGVPGTAQGGYQAATAGEEEVTPPWSPTPDPQQASPNNWNQAPQQMPDVAGGQPTDSQYPNAAAAPADGQGADPYGVAPVAEGMHGGAADGYSGGPTTPFAAAVEQAKRELETGRLAEAHYQLSRWYDDPNLTPAENQQLIDLLDQLAGTVIYSTQNCLESAYEVKPGENLEQIAQRYNVPWRLLAKINGIEDPNGLHPGERLKVVQGPFSAVVQLNKHMLTLMLNGAYAGRFPIGIGREHPPQEGQCFVTEKVVDPVYYGPSHTIERGSPDNPLGRRWLGLGNQLGIHGTNQPKFEGRSDLPGSIGMSDRDIDDVFDILSEGSKVTIRR